MKTMIVGAALISASFIANADTWSAPTKSGGEIILTDRACTKHKDLWQGYTVAPGGSTMWFCWTGVDGRIMAVYEDGTTYTYRAENFTRNTTSQPRNGGKQL